MAEGYINLFLNEHEGTNKPHYKLLFKIDGVDHEAALWPTKEGKKGFSGKYKPKQEYTHGLGYSDAKQEEPKTASEPEEKSPSKTELTTPPEVP